MVLFDPTNYYYSIEYLMGNKDCKVYKCIETYLCIHTGRYFSSSHVHSSMSDDEVHRKTDDTVFPGNSMTVAELEPLGHLIRKRKPPN